MAHSLNKVTLLGRLGKDPEIRYFNNADKMATFSLATSESYKDKLTGEYKEKTDWHNVVVYNDRLIDVIEKHLKKGSRVYLEGAIRTREYKDKNGYDRKTTDIQLGKFNGTLICFDSREDQNASAHFSSDPVSDVYVSSPSSVNYPDDEIPF